MIVIGAETTISSEAVLVDVTRRVVRIVDDIRDGACRNAGAGRGEGDRLQGRLVLGRRCAAAQGQHARAAVVAAADAVLIGEVERVGPTTKPAPIETVAPVTLASADEIVRFWSRVNV